MFAAGLVIFEYWRDENIIKLFLIDKVVNTTRHAAFTTKHQLASFVDGEWAVRR